MKVYPPYADDPITLTNSRQFEVYESWRRERKRDAEKELAVLRRMIEIAGRDDGPRYAPEP